MAKLKKTLTSILHSVGDFQRDQSTGAVQGEKIADFLESVEKESVRDNQLTEAMNSFIEQSKKEFEEALRAELNLTAIERQIGEEIRQLVIWKEHLRRPSVDHSVFKEVNTRVVNILDHLDKANSYEKSTALLIKKLEDVLDHLRTKKA